MKKFFSVILLATVLIFAGNSQTDAASRNEYDFDEPPLVYRVVNCNEWISLRYAPSVYSERLAKIPLGAIVTVFDCAGYGIDGFYPVEYRGMKGYCLREYLQYVRTDW